MSIVKNLAYLFIRSTKPEYVLLMLLLVLFNKANASQSVVNPISFNLHFNAWSFVAFSLNSFSNIASAVELRPFLPVNSLFLASTHVLTIEAAG